MSSQTMSAGGNNSGNAPIASGEAIIMPTQKQQFPWTWFYEAFADKLLEYQSDRSALVQAIHEIAGRVSCMGNLTDKFTDGPDGPIRDICPFTAMSIFNRNPLSTENRRIIAGELACFLGIDVPVPESFEGIPC